MPNENESQQSGTKRTSWSVMDFETDATLLSAMTACTRPTTKLTAEESAAYEWELENPDVDTTYTQSLDEEMARLRVLKSYLLLDSGKEPKFERITALAGRIFKVPIALVSLVDLGRQWFMSNRGLGDVRETPRNMAFCAHAIMSTQDLLVVPDAVKDPRFTNNPLVTGEPGIRFYAGAPLVCPEGYKLGTLCIIDRKERPSGLSLMEKQNLRELAAMVVEIMVQRRVEKEWRQDNTSKMIACTAHDLLTPLSGIELNLSMLMDDKNLWNSMDEHQRELIQTANSCSDVMRRICQQAIETFRGDPKDRSRSAMPRRVSKQKKTIRKQQMEEGPPEELIIGEEGDYDIFAEKEEEIMNEEQQEENIMVIHRVVENLRLVIEPCPKVVPLSIHVDDDVPAAVISDDLKVFRAALNYLTNACKFTKSGSINLRIFVKKNAMENGKKTIDMLMFECEDTGPGVDAKKYPNLIKSFRDAKLHNWANDHSEGRRSRRNTNSSGLGLCSVASNISSLNGEYGFHPRVNTSGSRIPTSDNTSNGSVFWFSIPLVVPSPSILKKYRRPSKTTKSGNSMDDAEIPLSSFSEVSIKEGTSNIDQPEDMQYDSADQGHDRKNVMDIVQDDAAIIDTFQPKPKVVTLDVPVDDSKPFRPVFAQRAKRAIVIDDSLTIRKSIDRALTKQGFIVSQGCNGMEGLEQMQSYLFDVCLCDFLMPVMDGLDCVQQYRAWEADHRPWFRMHIIGISAHASQSDAERGVHVGMDKFYPKPLPLKTLKEISASPEVTATSKLLDEKFDEILSQMENNVVLNTEFMELTPAADDAASCNTESHHSINSSASPVALIAMGSKSKPLSKAIEKRGFQTSWVYNGDEALKLLKVRNWDIVLLDDQIPLLTGTSCITIFREWETRNRVVRQNHVYLISGNFVPKDSGGHNIYPPGFDGALGKPILIKNLHQVLDAASARGKMLDRLL